MARAAAGPATWLVVLVTVILAACSGQKPRAPVEERPAPQRSASRPASEAPRAEAPRAATPPAAASAPADSAKPPLPGAENAGKPGYYTVKPGDTLIRIGLENGQGWRDIARWNALENPNRIEVGQVLRVVPPNVDAEAVAARGVPGPRAVEPRPIDARPAVPPAAASAPVPTAAASSPAQSAAPAPTAARDGDDDIVWAWPSAGAVAGGFEEGRSRGLQITGKAGDPVVAAADGRVIYVGSALRGYGNLIILKHNATYLTAYAHNRTLLVKDDQAVRRGQVIAEMGSSDADRVQLHFEIRRQGKPIDPLKLLPAR